MTAFASVALLAVGIGTTLRSPARIPDGALAVLAALAAVGLGVLDGGAAVDAVHPLVSPLLFLLLAAPLASMLDALGVFEAAASLATGRHLAAGCWVLAAVTVAALNLDTAVILLTPLYVTLARRAGIDPLALAAQPAILACLASSGLPVSNLTNLIATEQGAIGTGDLVRLLGPATLVATAVGYAGWRVAFRRVRLRPVAHEGGGDGDDGSDGVTGGRRRPLVIGGVVVTLLLIGFLAGRSVGIPAWVVVLAADVGLLAIGARPRISRGPFSTAAAAAALAVLAAGVAAHVDVAALLTHTAGRMGEVRTVGIGAGASALTNNLPALLVLLPSAVGVRTVAALLLGLNLGPVVVVTGSLSGLLWMDAARRAGLKVGALDYARFGLLAGGPALIAATATFVLLH